MFVPMATTEKCHNCHNDTNSYNNYNSKYSIATQPKPYGIQCICEELVLQMADLSVPVLKQIVTDSLSAWVQLGVALYGPSTVLPKPRLHRSV